jgi:hypothetical protein
MSKAERNGGESRAKDRFGTTAADNFLSEEQVYEQYGKLLKRWDYELLEARKKKQITFLQSGRNIFVHMSGLASI